MRNGILHCASAADYARPEAAVAWFGDIAVYVCMFLSMRHSHTRMSDQSGGSCGNCRRVADVLSWGERVQRCAVEKVATGVAWIVNVDSDTQGAATSRG